MNPGRHSELSSRVLVFVLVGSFAAGGLAPAAVLGQGKKDAKRIAADTRPLNQPEAAAEPSDEAAIQNQINSVYDSFYHSYRLGPGDVIAIHVDKHPEDSAERIVVSPVGQVYYSLLGNVTVVGKTMPQLQEYFTTSISEFIREPRVTVSMLEANSSKIGVLGDVRVPGVILMTHPMKVLDAITAAGGVTDLGSSSDVSILRQYEDGRVQVVSVNVKNILKGKAGLEDNVYLRSGDTIIVHGNLFKKLGVVSSMLGIASFATFMGRGGR
jgi:polysaccharide export outer membrane protein